MPPLRDQASGHLVWRMVPSLQSGLAWPKDEGGRAMIIDIDLNEAEYEMVMLGLDVLKLCLEGHTADVRGSKIAAAEVEVLYQRLDGLDTPQ